MNQAKLSLALDNIRSIHNVGSILRTAEGFGVSMIHYIGTTPFPAVKNDPRLPFKAQKQTKQIHKTALGAELILPGFYYPDYQSFLDSSPGQLVALEQTERSIDISNFKPKNDVCLVVGNEVNGVSSQLLKAADQHLEIAMVGQKESFNVSVACGIALFSLV